VSRKIQITPLMTLEADMTVMNDRNASVALVHLFDSESGEVMAHATGASKREQGDIYNESVAVRLAVGRALQKMSREMISAANKEVKAAMVAAEIKEADKVQAAYDRMADLRNEHDQRASYDRDRVMSFSTIDEVVAEADARDAAEEFADLLMELLGLKPETDWNPSGLQPPLTFDGEDKLTPKLEALMAEGNLFDGETLNADGIPVTADGTPVSDLPVDLRVTLASLGFRPSQVQVIDLDKLEAEGVI